jgi:hypothetical protein
MPLWAPSTWRLGIVGLVVGGYEGRMTTTPCTPSYAGYRFPAEVISYAVYLYFRFPLSLRMVEEMLAVRGIEVSHETVRQWGLGPKGNAGGV